LSRHPTTREGSSRIVSGTASSELAHGAEIIATHHALLHAHHSIHSGLGCLKAHIGVHRVRLWLHVEVVPALHHTEYVLLRPVSNGYIEPLDDVNEYLGLLDGLQRHGLPLLHDRLQLSPRDKHLVEESKQRILALQKLKFSYNTLVLSGGLRVGTSCLLSLEVLELVEKHLPSTDALSVKFHRVVLQWEIEYLLFVRVLILIGLFLLLNLLLKVLFEGLLTE